MGAWEASHYWQEGSSQKRPQTPFITTPRRILHIFLMPRFPRPPPRVDFLFPCPRRRRHYHRRSAWAVARPCFAPSRRLRPETCFPSFFLKAEVQQGTARTVCTVRATWRHFGFLRSTWSRRSPATPTEPHSSTVSQPQLMRRSRRWPRAPPRPPCAPFGRPGTSAASSPTHRRSKFPI